MTVLGVDLSHFQGSPNFAQIKASGRDFVVLKATEGTTYVDPTFAANRAAAHAAGLLVGLYHFGRGGNVAAEAAWFVKTIGPLAVGEFLVLDNEVPAISAAWAQAWCDAVCASTTVKPLVYMNRSTLAGSNWAPLVADDDGLWLASYDGSTTAPASGAWPAAAMKQYSDAGTVAGIAGKVDLDVFYGSTAQLAAYGLHQAAPAAAPASAVQGEIAVKYATTPGLAALLGAPVTPEMTCPDGVGRFNHFANDSGSIYWTPATGAFSVHGAIAVAWAASGWEKGPLGYPISDEFGVDGYDRTGAPVSWRQSNFEHGCITWTPDGGAVIRTR